MSIQRPRNPVEVEPMNLHRQRRRNPEPEPAPSAAVPSTYQPSTPRPVINWQRVSKELGLATNENHNPGSPIWTCGLTTVPKRKDNLLKRTLCSIVSAGFPPPRLFVGGARDGFELFEKEWGCEITYRYPNVTPYANWILGLAELFLRNPRADRYFMMQDDFVCVSNLRAYLDQIEFPQKGYLNLYTFPDNQMLIPETHTGFWPSNQLGRGAVALVFNRETVPVLLMHKHMSQKAAAENPYRAATAIDGGIVEALARSGLGYQEYVHSPSLTQHTGAETVIKHEGAVHPQQPTAPTFPGEGFDALSLLSTASVGKTNLTPFLGSWRLYNGNQLSSHLTIRGDRLAMRHHVPELLGTVEVIKDETGPGSEARLSYPDGHRDKLRIEHDGLCWVLGYGKVENGQPDWRQQPMLRLRAVRVVT